MDGKTKAREILNALPDPSEHLKIGVVVGEGAYGKVYKGLIRATNEVIAVKIVQIAPNQEA